MSLETLIPVTCKCGEQVYADPSDGEFPCGCGGARKHGPPVLDLRGRVVGSWVVVGLLPRDPGKNQRLWLCRCSGCDRLKAVQGNNLRSGMSAGCASCRARGRHARGVDGEGRRV